MTLTVTSKDGTTIGYRKIGTGPALVILHGAMEASHSHLQLARALAGHFTSYLPDRRGRGASGPFGDHYSLSREVEDLSAILDESGAGLVLGVSSGAIITLRTALRRPDLRKAIIFEPPLSIDGSNDTAWVGRFDDQIARGDVTGALATGMKRTKMGPPIFHAMPDWLLKAMNAAMIAQQSRNAVAGEPTYRELAPTLHYDVRIVAESADSLGDYAAVDADVMLLGGGKSPAYLKRALTALEGVLPHAVRVELAGLGHGATGPANQGGKPEVVAREVRAFAAI